MPNLPVEDDMAYLLDCPGCNHELQVPEGLLGQLVRCPECAKTFTAPTEIQDANVPAKQHGAPPAVAAAPTVTVNRTPGNQVAGFRCPYCQSQAKPHFSSQISIAGWIVFAL